MEALCRSISTVLVVAAATATAGEGLGLEWREKKEDEIIVGLAEYLVRRFVIDLVGIEVAA